MQPSRSETKNCINVQYIVIIEGELVLSFEKKIIFHSPHQIHEHVFVHVFAKFSIASTAQCRQPSDFGTCRDDIKVMWFYNITSRKCERFWFGGCNGNDNRFKSEKECKTICTGAVQRGI